VINSMHPRRMKGFFFFCKYLTFSVHFLKIKAVAASDLCINLPNYISEPSRNEPLPKHTHTHTHTAVNARATLTATPALPLSHHTHCPATERSDSSSTHTPQGSFAYKGEKAARKTEVGMDYKRSMSQR